MTCAESRPLLAAYLDRELDSATSAQLAAHVADCAACRAALDRAAAVHQALASAALAYAPPAELAGRIRAAVGHAARPRRTWYRQAQRWAAVPLAAMLAATVAFVTTVNLAGRAGRDQLVDELIGGHVRALMVDHLVDVASTDQHTVRPWFNGKIDFAPPVADFSAAGFPLVGGRVDYIGGRPVAVLVYHRRQHLVNVFIWPAEKADETPQTRAIQGYHLLRWDQSGLRYWAVSDLNAAELETLAALLRGEHS
jgi:anti-sigma factor RsiW